MEEHNILCIANRSEFRAWLEAHHASERECWACVKRGRPVPTVFVYHVRSDDHDMGQCTGRKVTGRRANRLGNGSAGTEETRGHVLQPRRREGC